MPVEPLEPTQLLHYIPRHKVLICRECRYAIQPSAISRHLKELHRIYRSRRQTLLEYAQGLDLADPKDVTLPGPDERPVPLLTTIAGLACEASGCNHLCATLKRMKKHWTEDHSTLTLNNPQWRPVNLQTFFRGNQLRYFIVRQSSPTLNQQELRSNIDQEITTSRTITPSPPLIYDSDAMTIECPQLLQHFQTSTYLHIGHNEVSRQVWRTEVPILAAEYPFLKHGILACSALHLAYLYPSRRKRYQLIAAYHQNIALPEFRVEIATPNSDNCFALMVFSQLLIFHCFSADQQDEDLLLVKGKNDPGLPDWLQVLRGSCNTFMSVWPHIEGAPLIALMMVDLVDLEREQSGSNSETIENDERLHALAELIKPSTGHIAQNVSNHASSPLSLALLALSRAFANAKVAQSRNTYSLWTATYTWPMQVTQEYLDLLKDREPVALILLAHYCILLRPLEKTNWYMSGYSKRLLTRIRNQLDEEWHPWLTLPLEEIGS
ncbi:hypothetical protein F5884DRAFT_132114 [Xylogone sp. PMI_703]|nr:hypothetical protein F5884DRAFT_132114 [Xylogone sp. PMI_703]